SSLSYLPAPTKARSTSSPATSRAARRCSARARTIRPVRFSILDRDASLPPCRKRSHTLKTAKVSLPCYSQRSRNTSSQQECEKKEPTKTKAGSPASREREAIVPLEAIETQRRARQLFWRKS